MSEKIYAWLLHLYPSPFRKAYGEEALQLFRDRSRDEKGLFPSLRLWLDLLADLAISVPRVYRHVQPAAIDASAQQRWDGTPSFHVLEGEAPRPGALLFGSILALAAVATLSISMGHVGNHRPLRASVAHSQPSANAQPSASSPSAAQTADDAEEETIASGQSAMATTQLSPGGTKANDFQGKPILVPDATSAMIPALAEDVKLDAAERQRVIDGAVANLKEYYVYPNIGQKMADALLAHEKSGDDDAITDGEAFAGLLTRQMTDVSHDRQLMVVYYRVKPPDRPPGPTPETLARYREALEQNNCFFEKTEILAHNIGYLKLNSFSDPALCQPTAAAAMASLNRADAIIFDLRDNTGGYPSMVALIAGYLFAQPTHLNDMYNRGENSTLRSWTPQPVAGNRLANKAAYVLTSRTTFSGAEEFSYDLKMLKRATIVGEATSGRGHIPRGRRIDDHFEIRVPDQRSINPISKTDWDGPGVVPDVKVKAADALETAQKLAENKLH
jgi:Peptidase family S41/N-terminal domain of Peptidase_S41 in eukaryotic IRBP